MAFPYRAVLNKCQWKKRSKSFVPGVGMIKRLKIWGKTSVITLLCIVVFIGFAATADVDPGPGPVEFPVRVISALGIFGLFILFLVQRRHEQFIKITS